MTILFTLVTCVEVWGECRFSPIKEDSISSGSLAQVLKDWKAQGGAAGAAGVDDIVCCLPEKWRKNFVVIPESHSLQCSSQAFPRVILFDPEKSGQGSAQPLQTAISFVGSPVGDTPCNYKFSGNNNSQDLEIMEFNKKSSAEEMFQFSHFDPKKDKPVSQKPYVCMDCHGTPKGWRPLSKDHSLADTHLGGLANPGAKGWLNCNTAQEQEQQKQWGAAFKELALNKKQRPYSCLSGVDNLDAKKLQELNKKFIERLAVSQNYLVADKIRSTPEYNRYKKAIVAASLGCAVSPDLKQGCDPKSKAQSEGRDLADFLPAGGRQGSPQDSSERAKGLICQSSSGLCGSRIPEKCTDLLRETNALVQKAENVGPAGYGSMLSQAFYDQGRSALFSPEKVQKHTQLNYLLGLQVGPENAVYSEIINEFAGPNSIDFDHLAKILIEKDKELSALLGQSLRTKNSKSACDLLAVSNEPTGRPQVPAGRR